MKTKTKAFDGVAMKRAAAAKVYRKTRGMSFPQKVAFWTEETAALIQEQKAAKTPGKSSRRVR
ncbi:MAG: hypothetical protein NT031_11250 [Planctomycetota bacterium]|nr:hypothetical protein [Planctomycetota bacterium]